MKYVVISGLTILVFWLGYLQFGTRTEQNNIAETKPANHRAQTQQVSAHDGSLPQNTYTLSDAERGVGKDVQFVSQTKSFSSPHTDLTEIGLPEPVLSDLLELSRLRGYDLQQAILGLSQQAVQSKTLEYEKMLLTQVETILEEAATNGKIEAIGCNDLVCGVKIQFNSKQDVEKFYNAQDSVSKRLQNSSNFEDTYHFSMQTMHVEEDGYVNFSWFISQK